MWESSDELTFFKYEPQYLFFSKYFFHGGLDLCPLVDIC